jgi:hypothetical protein
MSAERDWGRRRRAGAWLNVAVQSVLVVGLVVVVSLIARKSPARWDLTSTRAFTLSSTTADLLRGLDFDVTIWMNTDPGESQDQSLNAAMSRTIGILGEFRRRSSRIRVNVLARGQSPDPVFAKHWSTVSPATLYILSEDKAGKTNKKTVETYSLFEGHPGTGQLHHYRGEAVLAQSIRELTGTVKRIVYEVAGHGELLTAMPAMGGLKQLLAGNEGVEFRALPMADVSMVPTDCQILLVLGPSLPFQAEELGILREYLERGGSMVVALRPKAKTGLETLLAEYGVKVRDGIILDPQRHYGGIPFNLVVTDFNAHEVNRGMVNVRFAMPESANVEPLPMSPPQSWKITPLAMTSPHAWLEKDDPGLRKEPRPDPDEPKGDLKLIVAVEKSASRPMDDRHKVGRLVVWGSVRPFMSDMLFVQGVVQETQYNYLVNHLRWLSDRDVMEIQHVQVDVKPLELSPAAIVQLRWVVLAGFPTFGVLLGVFAWFMRRK